MCKTCTHTEARSTEGEEAKAASTTNKQTKETKRIINTQRINE